MSRTKAAEEPAPFTIAVDLDGTLAAKEEPFSIDSIGAPRAGARTWLRKFRKAGARVIIYTVRGNDALVARWLADHAIPYDYINHNPDQPPQSSGKIFADVYWDDRAIRAETLADSGPEILAMIHEKQAEDVAAVTPEDVFAVLGVAV